MARINEHYAKLPASYLFPEIGRRVRAYQAKHPDVRVIRLGIGDVTEPLAPSIVAAMHAAVDEMGARPTFRGYGPELGYDFLVDAIRTHDFASRGVDVAADEIFVSDVSKCDSGNVQEIFAHDARIAIADPVYPVYVDSNVMAGRTAAAGPDGRYPGFVYLQGTEANNFQPDPPSSAVDVAYLCSPNNPTGTVATRAQLERWVAWARNNDAIILFDAAYESYISDPSLPRSIYEIAGARGHGDGPPGDRPRQMGGQGEGPVGGQAQTSRQGPTLDLQGVRIELQRLAVTEVQSGLQVIAGPQDAPGLGPGDRRAARRRPASFPPAP